MENEKMEVECFRYLSKEGSEQEQFLFELELSINDDLKREYALYKKIWDAYPLEYDGQNKAMRLLSRLRTSQSIAQGIKAAMAIAATVVIGWFLINDTKPNQVSTQANERMTFYLPDSTKVILNSESSLAYKNDFLRHRNVVLEGEAFFDVAHDRSHPFIVHTEDIEVMVLGTEFNVNTSSTMETVSLEHGKVNVTIPENGMNVTLLPSEEVVYDPVTKNIDKRRFDPSETLVWKDDVLVLEDVSLKAALSKINNYYGIQLIPRDTTVANKSIQGVFRGKNIKEFKEAIEFITGFTVQKDGEQTYTIGKDED
jgi:ferric-dicitrate binding protein FerR (iron transport regulator)